jgi:hypothetical protein
MCRVIVEVFELIMGYFKEKWSRWVIIKYLVDNREMWNWSVGDNGGIL